MRDFISNRGSIQFLLATAVLLTACASRGTIMHYITPNHDLQEIKLIAILPSPWDSQDDDIFYATNYFYNELVGKANGVKMIDIGNIRELDRGNLAGELLALVDSSFSDINSVLLNDSTIIFIPGLDSVLNSTRLGIFLRQQNVDAVLFGQSNCHQSDRITIISGEDTYTICSMNYYLVSTADGRILWHMEVEHDRQSILVAEHKISSGMVSQERQITPDYYVLQDVVNTMMGALQFPLDKLQTPHKSWRSNQRARKNR